MICYYPDPLSLIQKQGAASFITIISPTGAVVELSPYDCASYQVQNLISTDPQEYLTGSFRPGQIVDGKTLASFL